MMQYSKKRKSKLSIFKLGSFFFSVKDNDLYSCCMWEIFLSKPSVERGVRRILCIEIVVVLSKGIGGGGTITI